MRSHRTPARMPNGRPTNAGPVTPKLMSHSGSPAKTSYRFAVMGLITKSPNVHIDERKSASNARNSLPFDRSFAVVMTLHLSRRGQIPFVWPCSAASQAAIQATDEAGRAPHLQLMVCLRFGRYGQQERLDDTLATEPWSTGFKLWNRPYRTYGSADGDANCQHVEAIMESSKHRLQGKLQQAAHRMVYDSVLQR